MHPGHRGGAIDVGRFKWQHAVGIALLARMAHLRCQPASLGKRQREHGRLPWGAAHLGAVALVLGVRQAQRVTVREEYALPEGLQDDWVGQGHHATIVEHLGPDEKVSVADQEGDTTSARGLRQDAAAVRLESVMPDVVADPNVEQVAQNEHRVGRCRQQVGRPGLVSARHVWRQVQVGYEIDPRPLRRRCQFPERGQGGNRRRDHARYTTVAETIRTSSKGTSP